MVGMLNIEDRIAEGIPIWRAWVEKAGGNYVGVQTGFSAAWDTASGDDYPEPMVIFTRSSSTNLLAISVSKITQEAVAKKLGKNVTSFQKVEKLQEMLVQVDDAINALQTVRTIIEEIQNVD